MNFVLNNRGELNAGRAICLHAEWKIPVASYRGRYATTSGVSSKRRANRGGP